ncbi:MAG: MBL fold metallo-hydrolase [Provencibacterium sp.]|nr:MBL fold metallo-hydrolase [Provencibacterium sp.]
MLQIEMLAVGPLEENTYLLMGEEGCILIDPGEEAERISSRIEELGKKPALILLTHGHFDHIGAANALRARYGCPIAIGERDAEMLADPQKSLAGAANREKYCFSADRLLQEGDTLEAAGLKVSILETPGHTRGSLSYLCEGCLFSGDVLFFGSAGRTDLYGGDYPELLETLRALMLLPEDTAVYPGHGASTSIGREKRSNPVVQAAEDYDSLY